MRTAPSFLRNAQVVLQIIGVAALLLTRVDAQSRPEPPDLLTFEGTLVGAAGNAIGVGGPVNYPVVFRIFDRLVGGTLLWSEQQTVAVVDGRFAVVLGEGSVMGNEPRPALSALFKTSTASDRYVEVVVRGVAPGGSDATVSPRIRMASGAYSILATHARSAASLVTEVGQSVVTTVVDRVGVNQPNPSANLDVNGSVLSYGLDSKGSVVASGSVEAFGFDGLGMAPVGTIVMWTGFAPPRGWVLCDGSRVSGVKTPDLRGRFVLAAGNGPGLTPRVMDNPEIPVSFGGVGGAETHALTDAELPSHSHQVSLQMQVGGTAMAPNGYRVALGGNTQPLWGGWDTSKANTKLNYIFTDSAGAHGHDVDIPNFASNASGEGRPHNNMPPFYVLAFIMRVR